MFQFRWSTNIKTTSADCVLIMIITVFIYLRFLGLSGWSGNKPLRVVAAQEMLRTGDWMIPVIHGRPYILKPPLMNWLIALSGSFFGTINEWTSRLPSVLAMLMTSISVYFLSAGPFVAITLSGYFEFYLDEARDNFKIHGIFKKCLQFLSWIVLLLIIFLNLEQKTAKRIKYILFLIPNSRINSVIMSGRYFFRRCSGKKSMQKNCKAETARLWSDISNREDKGNGLSLLIYQYELCY